MDAKNVESVTIWGIHDYGHKFENIDDWTLGRIEEATNNEVGFLVLEQDGIERWFNVRHITRIDIKLKEK